MLTFVFDGKSGQMEAYDKLLSGTVGQQVQLKFSSDWDSLQKTAVFMALEGSIHTTCSVEVTQDIIDIPYAVLEHPEHTLYLQIQGLSPDGTEIINSGRVKGPRIMPGYNAGELPEIDGANPVWFDVLRQMGNLVELETDSKSTLVSAINELAARSVKDGASAYEIAQENGFEGSEAEWLDTLNGKSAYAYAQDAGFVGTEEEFISSLLGSKDIFIVDLAADDNGGYFSSSNYYEIAHAQAMNKLVLLRYGIFITHILAGEPMENSFFFEPLLHSVPGMPGYIVDIHNNWNSASPSGDEQESGIFIIALEENDGHYNASASYYEIADAKAKDMLVFLRYGTFITHILAGFSTDTSFLFEPILHGIPGIHGYIVDSEDSWSDAEPVDLVYTSDIIDNLSTNAVTKPLSAAQGLVLKGLYDALKDSVDNMGPDLFVGTENTTVAEFSEAFASGKPCFLMKATAGAGITMWVAYSCGTNLAHFYRVASDGAVQYGVLDSEGTFTYETAVTGESNVFIGGNDTTLAEFKAAYDSGKTCFLRRSNPSGVVTYTAYNVTTTNAFFFAINTTGAIEYAYLDSSNAFTAQGRKHVTTIDENSTDDQIPTAKAVYDAVEGKLDATALPTAVNNALAQAKARGEFDGPVGPQGEKGDTGAQGLPGVAQVPLFANSVEECTDTSKVYVLPDGYIYAYMTKRTEIAPPELIVHGANKNYQINKRINSSGADVAQDGVFLTNQIAVDLTNPCEVYITGLKNNTFAYVYGVYMRVEYYENGTRLGANVLNPNAQIMKDGNGWKCDIYQAEYAGATHVRFWISCNADAALTEDDADGYYKNISITIPALGGVEEVTAWMSTGLPFVPADYEDRIIALEEKTASMEKGVGDSLKGKKIVYDGDSIFAYSRMANPIAEITGSTYENQAVSSAWISATTEKHSVVNNLANLPTDGDLYCFEGGINDFWNDVPIGEVTSSYTGTLDTGTLCGALETIFRYAQENFVGKPVCFVIVHKISNTATSQNGNGDTFTDYHDAMVQVCEKYSVPYYDAFKCSGLNVWCDAQKEAYCPDLVHPNDEGHKRYYVPQMLTLFRENMRV